MKPKKQTDLLLNISPADAHFNRVGGGIILFAVNFINYVVYKSYGQQP